LFTDLFERFQAVLSLMLKTSSARLRGVELSIFASLEKLFDKLDEGAVRRLDEHNFIPLAETAHRLLFQHDSNAYMESIRNQRAKALLALSKVPLPSLVQGIVKADAITAEISREPSAAVQDILRQVLDRLA
jgi:AcrR family transcriptional regulator